MAFAFSCCAPKRDQSAEHVYPASADEAPPQAKESNKSQKTPFNNPWYKPDVHNLNSMNEFVSNAPFLEDYDTIRRVHTSNSGSSMLELCEQRSTGERWMVKIINKGLAKRAMRRSLSRSGAANPVERIANEVSILERLEHSHVVRTEEVIEDEVNGMLYIVMEYLEGGPAMRWNEINARYDATDDYNACCGLDPDTARSYFSDVVKGLRHIHEMNVVHRDIKPEVGTSVRYCGVD